MRSREGYFGVYFPSCTATREKHQITFVIINKADLRQYIPRRMHKIRALSCFILVRYWSGLPFNLTALPRLPMARTTTRKNMAWWRHQMENFPRYWPFVRGIHRSPVDSPHKGQWRGASMFSFICAWPNGWANNMEHGTWTREVPCCFSWSHDDVIKWRHFTRYWLFAWGIHRWIPLTKASDAQLWCFLWSAPQLTLE